jgi:hypothetical protein
MEDQTPIQETLRDKIALHVLPEIIRETGQLKYKYGGAQNLLVLNCRFAYTIADYMLQARKTVTDLSKQL